MSTPGDIKSTLEDAQYIGGNPEYIGGNPEYIGGIS